MQTVKRTFIKRKPRNQMSQKELENDDIYNSDTILEKILTSKKIRYDILNVLFTHIPENVTTVNMYIDIMSIINNIYNPHSLETISSFDNEKRFIISSSLLNMAAHFRNYFATRKGLYTNFVFFYSLSKSKNEINIYPDYKKDYYEKRIDKNSEFMIMNNMIKENLKILNILSDYLPHIYFVNTKDVNPLLIPYHFCNNSNSDEEISIIYSNDKLQMLNCINFNNVYLLTSNLGKVNLYNKFDSINLYSGKENDEFNSINFSLLPYLYCISGYKKYNITGFKNHANLKALKLIKKLIDKLTISNINYYDPNVFIKEVSEKLTEEQVNILKRNISLFHIPTMYNNLNMNRKFFLDENIKDLQDMKSLVEINNEYYEKYPLHLEELMLGEDYESV